MARWRASAIQSMEMVHLLKLDQNENAVILRMSHKNPDAEAENIFREDGATKEAKILEREILALNTPKLPLKPVSNQADKGI